MQFSEFSHLVVDVSKPLINLLNFVVVLIRFQKTMSLVAESERTGARICDFSNTTMFLKHTTSSENNREFD